MNVEKLKQKILDLAIRGKLVPQDPNDEPASVLIEKIKAEKERLVKEGKIKASKDDSYIYKGSDNCYYEKKGNIITDITDEIPFDIPNNWSWARLSSIGTTNIGLTYKPDDICDNGTIVLRSSNIKNNKIDLSDLVRVNSIIQDNQYIIDNDILICARNGSKALVGKCALYTCKGEKMAFGAFMAIFRTICYKYAYYYFTSVQFRSNFENEDNKQINQVTQDILKKSLIPIPPLKEQYKICEILDKMVLLLDSVMNDVSSIEKLVSCAKTKILENIFNDDSSYKSYYKNRRKTTLSELIPNDKIGDGDWVLSENMDTNGEYSLVQLKHIGQGIYLDKPFNHINRDFFVSNGCTEIKENYILINRLIADNMNVCLLPQLNTKCITAVDVCWIAPSNEYNQKYLLYYLLSPEFQKQVQLKTSGTTRKRISKNNLIKLDLYLHDIKYQDIIVEEIDKMFNILDSIIS